MSSLKIAAAIVASAAVGVVTTHLFHKINNKIAEEKKDLTRISDLIKSYAEGYTDACNLMKKNPDAAETVSEAMSFNTK